MKQFIPLEDDWSLIEAFLGQRLVPYQPGMRCLHGESHASEKAGSSIPANDRKFAAPSSQVCNPAL